mmetsp:Transcript_55017/g.138966  ORF Transcript_55017/g.138966 Transcript_55017/m.138966 type:complete len:235 (-) Transcript_55017:486-1190(-)
MVPKVKMVVRRLRGCSGGNICRDDVASAFAIVKCDIKRWSCNVTIATRLLRQTNFQYCQRLSPRDTSVPSGVTIKAGKPSRVKYMSPPYLPNPGRTSKAANVFIGITKGNNSPPNIFLTDSTRWAPMLPNAMCFSKLSLQPSHCKNCFAIFTSTSGHILDPSWIMYPNQYCKIQFFLLKNFTPKPACAHVLKSGSNIQSFQGNFDICGPAPHTSSGVTTCLSCSPSVSAGLSDS